MPGQKLTPEKPYTRSSVTVFIRDSPSPRQYMSHSPHMLHCLQIFIWAVDKENKNDKF